MSEVNIINKPQEYAICQSKIVSTLSLTKEMTPVYESISDILKRHNIEFGDTCMPFAKYNNIDWAQMNKKGFLAAINMIFFYKWDLNIGITCPDSILPEGNLEKLNLNSGDYISMLHKGSYQKVGETYKKIIKFAENKSIKIDNYSIEFYLNDPKETPKHLLETEVLVPISKNN